MAFPCFSSLNRSPLLGSIVIFLLLTPLTFSRETLSQSPQPVNEFHGRSSIKGTINLSFLWYGKFTPVQKERVHDFVESLSYDAKESLDPKVSSWWEVVESYQQRYKLPESYQQKNGRRGRSVTPRIDVKIVRSYFDEKMMYGKDLTLDNTDKLAGTAIGDMSDVIPVIFLAPQVKAEGQGFCNGTCNHYSLYGKGKEEPVPFILVSDPQFQCPGECAWPFHMADKGPRGMTYQPPSGEIGADALVMQLATGLADFATNPAFTEALFKSKPPYIGKNDDVLGYILDPATACTGIFGSGAFPGFTGKIRVDPITGGAFNSHGINNLKFLIPSVWDPKTKTCWTPM